MTRKSELSTEEIAVGAAHTPSALHPPVPIRPNPRPPDEILAEVMLELMQPGRIAIAFSGGVDSSGLLCAATAVARTHGLDDPVAVTARFPHAPRTDESRWQELVIDRLGIADWVRVEFTDECDVIGTEAQPLLRRYGVRWPPLVHAEQPLMRACGCDTYMMGNGGDEITMPTRAGVLQLVAHGTVRRDRKALEALGHDLTPQLHWVPGRLDRVLPAWIRPDARAQLRPLVADHHYRRVFRWAPTLEHRTNAPWARRGHAAIVESGADAGVRVSQPLTDPRVVGAMLVAGGRWGFPDRATAARRLFGPTLPDEICRRTDKADFTDAYIAGPSRAFIDAWDGTGVPLDLVDPQRLRAEWRSASPRYSSIPLLQHAWLAHDARVTERPASPPQLPTT